MGNDKIVFFGAGILASILMHSFVTRIGTVEALEDARNATTIGVSKVVADGVVRHGIVQSV